MRYYIVLFLLFATPLHAQDTTESPPATNTNAPAETVAVDNVADDSAIRDRLMKIYGAAKNAGWLSDVDVILDSGIVTLKGQSDTEQHRQWAANVARQTEDVVAVINELTVVPNATLFKNNVDVLTSQPQRRVRIICGVAYDENVDESREVIRDAVQSCESVQGKRTVEVFASEFASSSVNFEVAWWTGSKPVDIRRSRDEVVAAIKRSLDDAGIEIPFPYRTLTFKNPADVQALRAAQEHPSGT